MYIKDFEKEIQRDISPNLNIRPGGASDVCGIYYKDKYINTAVPSQYIFDTYNPRYTDVWGTIHPSRPVIKKLIKFKLKFLLCK